MIRCPACRAANPGHARFCLQCGSRIDEAPRQGSTTRRVVTALFCDVVGSTALGERLDPEALRSRMLEYVGAVGDVISRHGGRVGDLLGDGVLGVFGVPEAHEDDALRAVRAAADILSTLSSPPGRAEGEDGLSVRIGINTGEVLTSDEDSLVLGDCVNVAARLQSVASAEDVLLGESTYRLVRDAVEVEQLGEVRLKGRDAPVTAHRLLRVLAAAQGVARRTDAPLVGREADVAVVVQAFERCTRDGRAQLVTVLGDPGVGKTRLALEAVRRLGARARVVTGHCRSYGDGITFLPLADALDDLTAQAGQLPDLLRAEPDAEFVTQTVLALARGMSSAVEGAFPAVRRLFEATTHDVPLVVVVEDIHWGEPALLDLVEYVARETRARVLVLCLARPELMDARPGWGGGGLSASTVVLYPLSPDDAKALATALGESADSVAIARASGGNPLFIEHLVALARDSGIDSDQLRIPEEIHGLLSARLDRLDPPEGRLVHVAAVIGMVVNAEEVAALVGEEVADVIRVLDRLSSKELFHPLTRNLTEARLYEFSHALVREAAYGRLSRQQRADLHERFHDWLSGQPDARPELLAYHLERAYQERGQLGNVSEHDRHLAEHAGTLLAGSGSRAFQQLDHPSASNLLGRARALLAPRHPLLTEFLPDLGISLVEISQLAAAEDVLDQALLLAAEENDLGAYWRARAERERLAIYLNPARPGLVELGDELDAALDNLAAVGDQLALARCWSLRVDIECCTGGRIGCGESGAKALAHAVAAGSRPDEERAIGYYVWQLVVGRTPLQEGIRICERLYAERQHDVMGEALCLLDLGLLVAATGRFDHAREYANRSMRACNDVGFAYWGTHALHVAGQIELWAKRPAQAEPYLRAALDRFAAAQDEWFQQLVAADIADALILLGRADEAESLLHGHERPSGDPDDVGHLSTIRSRALLALDRPEEAAAAARHAVSVLEKSDYPARLAYARLALARSLDVLDRGREARAAAEEARRLFLRKGHRIGQQATDDLLECMAVPAARRGPAASSPTSP